MLNKHTIPLFGKVVVPETVASNVPQVDERHVQMFTAEVSSLGYALTDTSKLKALDATTFFTVRTEVLDVLGQAANIPNVKVLFNKFPYDTPNQFEYLFKRIIGYLSQNRLKGHFLSCGHVIDERLFNPNDFGVCPICQFEVDELSTPAQPTNEFQNISPLKPLTVIHPFDVSRLAEKLLARNASLSEQEKALVALVMSYDKKLALPEKCFKETLPFIYYHYVDVDYVKGQLSGATDVLRIASYVSDPQNSDLSLAENTKFKFNERHRKNFLAMLDSLSNLEEDFMRHRERWLRIGHVFHAMSAKNTRKYPNVAMAFDTLRNKPESINTFTRQIERNIGDTRSLAKILATRPGEFGRRVDLLLRNAKVGDIPGIVKQFEALAPKLTLRMLFELASHLGCRLDYNEYRLFFVKGANKYHYQPDNRPPLGYDRTNNILAVIDKTIQNRLANRAELGKVFVDPDLGGRVVPFNTRGDSNKSENLLTKGSRYPVTADVIRLYVWWKGHVDVDLSASIYDENWNYIDHVAYTNLRSKEGYAVHSGDIQNAPNGATEFIDIDIEKAIKQTHGARYVVSTLISFRGDGFDSFPCYAGFMERDRIASGQLFEPESVVTKVEVNSKATGQMMFAFDLQTRQVILMDMQSGKGRYGSAARHDDKFRAIAKGMTDLPRRKPNFYDVAFAYANANGKIVFDKNEADTILDANMDVQMIHDILAG